MNDEELYKKAIALWGYNLQIDVAIEEMAELTQALIKWKRKGQAENLLDPRIDDEMADVEIMLEQLKLMFKNKDHVTEQKKLKLDRLEERIEIAQRR